MLIKKKPADDTKLSFQPMGAKPQSVLQKVTKPDVENAADAKMPGDKKEDAADRKTPKKKNNYFAKKAATALAGK